MADVDVLNETPPASVRVGGKKFTQAIAASRRCSPRRALLQRLPGQVLERQRGELARTLSQAQNLSIVVQCGPAPAVKVYDGARLLVEIPVAGG